MDDLFLMARGANTRFPEGNAPFQIVARILEECGEVASEVNLWEDTGIKRKKHGDPKKEDLANEIRQALVALALVALAQLALYYDAEDAVRQAVETSLRRMRDEGLIA